VSTDPKKFQIPTEFVLFGNRFIVSLVPDLLKTEHIYGDANSDQRLIRLQPSGKTLIQIVDESGTNSFFPIEVSKEIVIETFYHELFHIILDSIGESELSANEKFVNLIGKSMLEVYLSSEYEKTKR
jgi:hypothetical protein